MMLLCVVLASLALPALFATGYLALLTLLSWRLRTPPAAPARLRFDVVVPAHDEEAGISRTVKNLLSLDWPANLFRVIVVADNCNDQTADRATEAGATVLTRRDRTRCGKGYALDFAFNHSLADGFAHAVVVIDADTVVDRNLLAAFAGHLEAGAAAVQAEYTVLNPDASWRTRLMAIAFAMFHGVRSLGRARLGVSCGLRGNGMCFSSEVLRRVPHNAFSIVEDLEYGIRLGQNGIAVAYAPETRVFGEMVSSGDASTSQRRRWEGGRMEIIRQYGLSLLGQALARRDGVLFDLALDVLVPPLSWVVAYTGFGMCAAAMLILGHAVPIWSMALWLLPCVFLAAYVLRGVQLSGMGLRGLLSLAWGPAFLAWKLLVLVTHFRVRRRPSTWVRTTREHNPSSSSPG